MSPSKICGGKIYSITSTFGAKAHKLNVRVKRWHNRYEILSSIEQALLFERFAYQDQSYCITDLQCIKKRNELLENPVFTGVPSGKCTGGEFVYLLGMCPMVLCDLLPNFRGLKVISHKKGWLVNFTQV